MMGLFIGFIISIEGFEPRVEFEIFTISDKAKMTLGLILSSGIIYLAGTEYNNLKKRLKE